MAATDALPKVKILPILLAVVLILSMGTTPSEADSRPAPVVPLSAILEQGISLDQIAQNLDQKNYTIARIAPTGSMRPALDDHDFILVSPVPFHQLSISDIVVANYDNRPVCHRIVHGYDDAFITRGDNSRSPDHNRLRQNNYMGKVVAILRNDIGRSQEDLTMIANRLLPRTAATAWANSR